MTLYYIWICRGVWLFIQTIHIINIIQIINTIHIINIRET